jgi:hypothetical protein
MQARDQGAAAAAWNPEVDVPVKATQQGAKYAGNFDCKSRWGCLQCDIATAAHDAAVLTLMVQNHYATGGRILFLTGTFPHDACDSLERGIAAVAGAWRYVRQGRAAQAAADLGLKGYVRAIDLTVTRNGWHPHVHALLFLERDPTDAEVAQLHDVMFARWRSYVTRAGYRTPHAARFKLERPRCAVSAARYVSEVSGSHRLAQEVVGTGVKSGRKGVTLTDICFAAARGEVRGVNLYREAEAALKHRKLLTFSLGYVAELKKRAIEEIEAGIEAEVAEASAEPTDFYLPVWFYLGLREAPGGLDDFDQLVKDALARDGPPLWRLDYWERPVRDFSGTPLGGLLAAVESLWDDRARRSPLGYYSVSAGLLKAAVRSLAALDDEGLTGDRGDEGVPRQAASAVG